MRLRKITVISVITLRAHFSHGIAKLDTLPNLLLTLDIIYYSKCGVSLDAYDDSIAEC